MDELTHGAFWFWAVILLYASWCAGNLSYARQAHKRISALEKENEAMRIDLEKLRTELRKHPLGFMRVANP